jgi:two-component system nitrogen regulation response regulator GlnG
VSDARSKHGSTTLSRTTLDPSSAPSTAAPGQVAALTIAAHPELQRLGQRAHLPYLLARGKVRISRTEPDFETSNGELTGPLRDAYLSREPIEISIDPGGIRIDVRKTSTALLVEGERVESATWIPLEALERGIVLELAGRIALLLHGHTVARRVADDDPQELIGDSMAMLRLREEIARATSHSAPALIRGESGSGKELVARAIHDKSARAAGPYVSVNVAAVPATTAAAELFGYHKGAFTGAAASHTGWFGRADGGTLFLDEIGEAPDALQPMLLRALESGDIQPVGAQGIRRVDVRVLAATDADLSSAVEAGRFRFPLYQRLAGHTIRVPALRDRRADIPALMLHFLRRELAQLGAELPKDGERSWLPSTLVVRALGHHWPGNVRELANFCRELALSSHDRRVARAGPVFESLLPPAHEARTEEHRPLYAPAGPALEPDATIDDAKLVATLRENDWKIAATSRALGVSKNTLYQMMERCPGIRKARDIGRDEIVDCYEEHAGDMAAMARALQVSERGLKLRMRELGIG